MKRKAAKEESKEMEEIDSDETVRLRLGRSHSNSCASDSDSAYEMYPLNKNGIATRTRTMRESIGGHDPYKHLRYY